MHVEFDSTQMLWAVGVIIAAITIVKYAVTSVRTIIKNAKDFIIDTVGPRIDVGGEVKKALTNGGGDIIRQIVRIENEMQSKLHNQETRMIVSDAITQHEQVEAHKLLMAMQEFKNDITDKYDLKPKRKK